MIQTLVHLNLILSWLRRTLPRLAGPDLPLATPSTMELVGRRGNLSPTFLRGMIVQVKILEFFFFFFLEFFLTKAHLPTLTFTKFETSRNYAPPFPKALLFLSFHMNQRRAQGWVSKTPKQIHDMKQTLFQNKTISPKDFGTHQGMQHASKKELQMP